MMSIAYLKPRRLAVCCTAVLALAVSVAVAQEFGGSGSRDTGEDELQSPSGEEALQVLREGTKIDDLPGSFQVTGDRTTFLSDDGKRSLVGLENLNLERIVRTLSDKPEQLQWSVSGIVSEYQGQNFLSITRAVVKSKTTENPTDRPRSRLTSQSAH